MKRNILWRLREQPTTDSLRELVMDKILTINEAREILFSMIEASGQSDGRDNANLKSEIKFLRDLVEKLSKNNTQIVEVIKEIRVPYYHQPWYTPYYTWTTGLSNTITGTGGVSFSTAASGTTDTTANSAGNFNEITTF